MLQTILVSVGCCRPPAFTLRKCNFLEDEFGMNFISKTTMQVTRRAISCRQKETFDSLFRKPASMIDPKKIEGYTTKLFEDLKRHKELLSEKVREFQRVDEKIIHMLGECEIESVESKELRGILTIRSNRRLQESDYLLNRTKSICKSIEEHFADVDSKLNRLLWEDKMALKQFETNYLSKKEH